MIEKIHETEQLSKKLKHFSFTYELNSKGFLFVGHLMSQHHAVWISRTDLLSCMCCHTESQVAYQSCYLTYSQCTDTGPTCPSTDPIMPGPLRVASRVPFFESWVWLNMGKQEMIHGSLALVDALVLCHRGSGGQAVVLWVYLHFDTQASQFS